MGYLISETTKEEPESMHRYRNLGNETRVLMRWCRCEKLR